MSGFPFTDPEKVVYNLIAEIRAGYNNVVTLNASGIEYSLNRPPFLTRRNSPHVRTTGHKLECMRPQ